MSGLETTHLSPPPSEATAPTEASPAPTSAPERADLTQLRFRPIILTTLTTFGGLTPMIFETSRQARFLIPMAISLGFGVLFATLVTLALVPSTYLIVEDLKKIARRLTRPPAQAIETAVAETPPDQKR